VGVVDSFRVITTANDNKTTLWNGKTGAFMTSLGNVALTGEFLIPGSKRRFAIGDANGVQLWDSLNGRQLNRLPIQLNYEQALKWSDDDKLLLIQNNSFVPGDFSPPAQIWDAETGKALTSIPLLDGFNTLLELSWAGRRLTTTSLQNGSTELWELQTATPTMSEMILNINKYSGYKIEHEELIDLRKEPSLKP
jgi:WD40 repeat protein